ncbi:hypothetical protein H920_07544 [Fukomys damarensis]|uniref:Uncharacterized protein n=1 Tax=Fukomys damarensis TaxID=885580 RepID=A0A091DG30_FUKDA|nr:hypothetical protein H920_07544 [Fukomys damarensis]
MSRVAREEELKKKLDREQVDLLPEGGCWNHRSCSHALDVLADLDILAATINWCYHLDIQEISHASEAFPQHPSARISPVHSKEKGIQTVGTGANVTLSRPSPEAGVLPTPEVVILPSFLPQQCHLRKSNLVLGL